MSSRWFNTAVVILWLATMTWLVREKVLPPLLIGEPPSYSEIISAQGHELPVGWELAIDGRRIGWAMTETKKSPIGMTEIRGRAHFNRFPTEAVSPGWLRPIAQLIGTHIDGLRMDAVSVLEFDTFGRLLHFDSAVHLEPGSETMKMRGTVEGGTLQLVAHSGGVSFSYEVPLPPKALMADALSPQSRLPGLHVGQSWSVPVFNPLWPSKNPIEIIHAAVEDTQPIFWGGVHEDAWVVVYRRDSGSGVEANQPPSGKLWVRRDGAVLRQEAMLGKSTIQFVRMSDKEAAKLIATIGPQWWTPDSKPPRLK
jgi:hypothetical protein